MRPNAHFGLINIFGTIQTVRVQIWELTGDRISDNQFGIYQSITILEVKDFPKNRLITELYL
mgnify:CR=1 FL=1